MWNIESSDDIPVVLEHRKNIGLRIVQVCIKIIFVKLSYLQGSIFSLVNSSLYKPRRILWIFVKLLLIVKSCGHGHCELFFRLRHCP